MKKYLAQVADSDIENFILGEENMLLGFTGREEMLELAVNMVSQARQEVKVFGVILDPGLIGDNNLTHMIEQFLIGNRQARLETLVYSSQNIIHNGHRVVEVLRRFMPRVECRLRNQGWMSDNKVTFIRVDEAGYIYQPNPDRFAGSASFNGASTAAKLDEIFTQLWHKSGPDPEMQPVFL